MKPADLCPPRRAAIVAALALAALLVSAHAANAETRALDHGWELLPDKAGTLDAAAAARSPGWRPVRAGIQWNAQFEDMRDYMGIAWYRASFDLPQAPAGSHVRLRFGAVDYASEVFVNGRAVGRHEGGYTPFVVDVTAAARPGANQVLVRVVDPPMDEKESVARFPDMLYKEIPHGKQNWYVQTGGIWQLVTLEVRPALFVDRVKVTPRVDGTFALEVAIAGAARGAGSRLGVEVRDPNGRPVYTHAAPVAAAGSQKLAGKIAAPMLWSPDTPSLYTVEARLTGQATDNVAERFGFRSFEARGGKFFLNGEPYYMIAALDQDFYPETIYSPPSEAYVRDMMLKGKRLGLNMLRCHIKVPDPMYLRAADEVGMLVWYEIPCWNDFNHFSPKAAERGERIFAEMTERDWNHPSIVIQSIINESWGADLKEPAQRQWLLAAFERARKLTAPLGRLVVDNSACCENFHLRTDIDDFHRYNSIPDFAAEWDRWVADFASRPKWTFSPHGDARRTGDEPLVVSEFGNWGLPALPADLPWWFPRDFAGREVTRPAGVKERFARFGFGRMFKDYDELAVETQWHQFVSLKHEIEEIRRHESIQGYVITEFTDINWEANGLMDMWRNPKAYAAELASLQRPDAILGRLSRRNVTEGERVDVETLVSRYGSRMIAGGRVWWSTSSGLNGHFDLVEEVPRGSVRKVGVVSFVAPEANRPRVERLLIQLRDRAGSLVAENVYDLFLYPKVAERRGLPALLFHDAAGGAAGLKQALAVAGYDVADAAAGLRPEAILVATAWDSRVAEHTGRGGAAIVLADAPGALPAKQPLKVVPRAGSDLDGNWVTNFNWVRREAPPYRDLAFTRVLGFESVEVVPRFIIQGVSPESYGDVLSGIFYGWLNNSAALTVQVRAGDGKALVTTYRFSAYGRDPYATHLFDAMIRYASGDEMSPAMAWQPAGGGREDADAGGDE